MFWGLILLALCAVAFLFSKRAAILFAIPLLLAMAVTMSNPPFVEVHFFAIYACIGVLTSLFIDWKIGALIGIVSLASCAHVFGFIDALQRDVAGEILFVLCLFAGSLSKPASGITGLDLTASFRRRNHTRSGLGKGA